jgi:hypothetical protein
LLKEPDQEELGGQRGHGEVEALDAQAGDAEDEADTRAETSPASQNTRRAFSRGKAVAA